MFCKNCGTELPDDAVFCTACGSSLSVTEEQTSAQTTAAPLEPITPVATLERTAKNRKAGPIIGLVAILVAAVLIAGIFLGDALLGNDNADAGTSVSSSISASSQPTSQSTSQTTSQSTPNPGKITLNSAELTYELTDADYDKFYDLLTQCKNAALEGQSGDAVMEISDKLDEQYAYMDSQLSIATVLYYCELTNEEASQLYLDCTEKVSNAYDAYMEMAKELHAAEFAAKERFFEKWTEADLAYLAAYTSEVVALQQRNSEITVAYQSLQNDSEMYTKMVPLYIEMVQNNNRIAQIFNYDNYYEYAYELSYTRDYGAEEISKIRALAAEYLPKIIEDALNAFMADMEKLSPNQQASLSGFLFDSFKSKYMDEIEAYFATLPEQTRADMLDMFDGNILLLEEAENAQDGAFTTAISEDRYICYFGPGYSNPLTIIHELGHYYGGQYTAIDELPLDLAETQSQGNEWLFLSFMENKMQGNLYNATVDYKLYSDLVTILLCVIIDEFEEQVYTHPNIANLTSADLDAIMEDVCKNYGGIEFLANVATDIQTYWRMVVVEQPVYYISYGVSAIAAINIFTIADDNYEEAVRIYCSIIEDVDLDEGFLGNIQSAGLNGPFDKEVYMKLQAMCN